MSTVTVGRVARLKAGALEGHAGAMRDLEWPVFWQRLCRRLTRDGYRPNTLRVYRQVLRDLRSFLRERHGLMRPGSLTREAAEGYLVFLSLKNVSWSWMASTIAVLRNAFDKLGGMAITTHMVTPRRNWPLPETLSGREVRLLLDALSNPRDRLLVVLLAGCGLRVSEACRIRWGDVDCVGGALRIEDPSGLRSRTVAIPQGVLPTFQGLAAISRRSDPLISGPRTDAACPQPLSARQVERVIQAAARRAGILKRVSPMILRHTYALRRLVAGDSIRAIQQSLGHRCVETTLRYQACLPRAVSPADPVSPELALRQATALLGRAALVLSTPGLTLPASDGRTACAMGLGGSVLNGPAAQTGAARPGAALDPTGPRGP